MEDLPLLGIHNPVSDCAGIDVLFLPIAQLHLADILLSHIYSNFTHKMYAILNAVNLAKVIQGIQIFVVLAHAAQCAGLDSNM